MKLSILIPTLHSRVRCFTRIHERLTALIDPYKNDVEIVVEVDNGEMSIGAKRNLLMQCAKGLYVAFIDCDDDVTDWYIEALMEGIETGADCCSLIGEITFDGQNPKTFIHSIQYNSYFEKDNVYYRPPNHLNCIKRELAIKIPFPEKNFGEDTDFAMALCRSGLLKTEHYIDRGLYYYKYITKKSNKMPYSQGNEENYILDYFKNQAQGKFIDIGAYDVFRFSNVRALFEEGWGGILVEPSPPNYNAIAEHYKDTERVSVLNIAIGETSGEVDFYESNGDAVGTTDQNHMNKWASAGVQFNKIKVAQVSVQDFMNEYCKDVDFLSIDTEATNLAVFRAIPDFVFQQIKMLCIEHDGGAGEIADKMARFGFLPCYINSENIVLAKQ